MTTHSCRVEVPRSGSVSWMPRCSQPSTDNLLALSQCLQQLFICENIDICICHVSYLLHKIHFLCFHCYLLFFHINLLTHKIELIISTSRVILRVHHRNYIKIEQKMDHQKRSRKRAPLKQRWRGQPFIPEVKIQLKTELISLSLFNLSTEPGTLQSFHVYLIHSAAIDRRWALWEKGY